VPHAERAQLTKAMYKAYWIDAEDVTDHKVLLDIAKRSGIPSAKHMTSAVFEDEQDRRLLEKATDKAIEWGSPGVPGFWVEDEVWTDTQGVQHRGQLYWGQDRMLFVEAVMRGLATSKPFDQVPNISSLHPRCVRNVTAGVAKQKAKLEFWYDFSSPWSFLGWTQLERLRKIFGDGLEIEMKPILVGALFRE
jgi:2-hydroxychromene-2-carboxylate isomerase